MICEAASKIDDIQKRNSQKISYKSFFNGCIIKSTHRHINTHNRVFGVLNCILIWYKLRQRDRNT